MDTTTFVGRAFELQRLSELYRAKKSAIAVIYGRRRIGKSCLVEHFARDKFCLHFEGLEGKSTPTQISEFTRDLARQLNDPVLVHARFSQWADIFDYLSRFFATQEQKTILFLDELQWLAAGQGKLISLLKKYWDNEWKKQKVLLILCGSVSSYMVKQVVKSKALYGRIDFDLCLGQLNPQECFDLLQSKRSKEEVFRYLLVLGGIPKYLESIDVRKSLEQNLQALFFRKGAIFVNEYEKIFYSQFGEHTHHEKIVRFLQSGPKSLDEIAHHLGLKSSGGVKAYLDNLEKALVISTYIPFDKPLNTNLKKYLLTDEYIRFYQKYSQPNLKLIQQNVRKNLFTLLVARQWAPWLGLAFENFCLKNADYLAEKMGFSDQVISYGPFFQKGDKGFQIDLLYLRSDKTITVCEMKYHDTPVTTKVIPEVKQKCERLSVPRGYTLECALISQFGPDTALRNADYFHHYLEVSDFFD